jgi:capsule polysaccharide export protein KpsE/RkpR
MSVKRLDWIEYLLIDIENEKDPKVQKFYHSIKAIIDSVRSKKISNEQGSMCIEIMIPSIVDMADEPYRITNLLKAIVNYTKKIS